MPSPFFPSSTRSVPSTFQRYGLAVLLSALLFTQGHLHYPPVLVAVVLVAGLTWGWLTVRYRSLWPAWVSHMLADTIIDNFFDI